MGNFFIDSKLLERVNKFCTLEMIYRENNGWGKERLVKEGMYRFFQPSPELRELLMLLEISRNSKVTQLGLAELTNLAPSMVNNYIKNLIRKGLIKMEGHTTRDIRYYLTHRGEVQKETLLSLYLLETIKLYKGVKDEFKVRLMEFYQEGIRKVVLYGASDGAEIILNVCREIGFNVIGIVDSSLDKQGMQFDGKMVTTPNEIENFAIDAVIITSFTHKDEIYEEIKHLEDKGIRIKRI